MQESSTGRPLAPRRVFGGHFGHFACAAGGTTSYIGILGTDVRGARLAIARTRGSKCGPLEGFQDQMNSRNAKAQYSRSQANAI